MLAKILLSSAALLLISAMAQAQSAAADDDALASQRASFLEAERLIEAQQWQAARTRIDGLADYPLHPYLVHALLTADIEATTADSARALLSDNPDIPFARSFRQAWILELARRGAWRSLIRDADNATSLGNAAQCRFAEALWRTGKHAAAWEQVAAVWPAAKSLPDACDPVLAAWREAGQMTARRVWQRVLKAVPAKSTRLVRYLERLLPPARSARLQDWLALRSKPQGLEQALTRWQDDSDSFDIMVLDVFRQLARSAPGRAAAMLARLDAAESKAGASPALRMRMHNALGERLARSADPRALKHLALANDDDALNRRAELSLRLRNWRELERSIELMTADNAKADRWRYWRARARELRNGSFSDKDVVALARERGYYAFLAADRLGQDYNMAPSAIAADREQIAHMRTRPALARISELIAVSRAPQARTEWFHLLNALDTTDQRVAARLAADREWHALAIFAAGRARSWDDLDLRFPLAHRKLIEQAAGRSGLSRERIFAIIRQESAFMVDARSSAGALGPMQLMPGTARAVARRLGLDKPSSADVMDPELNIALGSRYLAGLHERYDDNPVLAAAAYNAGPGNVARWLPQGQVMPAELWIEDIPFKETRDYVRRVLAYQAIYRFRMGDPKRRISMWMPPVRGG